MKDDSPILNSEIRSIEYKELFNLFSLFEKKMDDYSEKMKLENEIFGLDYSIEKEYGHIRELKIQLENLLLMEILKLTVKSTSRNNQAIIGRLLNKEEAMTVENELSVKTIESLIERSSEITDRIIKEHHENNERLKHQKDELYKSGCP